MQLAVPASRTLSLRTTSPARSGRPRPRARGSRRIACQLANNGVRITPILTRTRRGSPLKPCSTRHSLRRFPTPDHQKRSAGTMHTKTRIRWLVEGQRSERHVGLEDRFRRALARENRTLQRPAQYACRLHSTRHSGPRRIRWSASSYSSPPFSLARAQSVAGSDRDSIPLGRLSVQSNLSGCVTACFDPDNRNLAY